MSSYGGFISEIIQTPLVDDGKAVELELVIRRPFASGPYPTLVFNHGSTGSGDKPALFRRTVASASVANFFNDLGWMVVFPQRRGRGKSGGTYDEGFKLDRSGYACEPELSLPGVDRAIEDLDAAMDHLRARSDVDTGQMLIAGVSRGGVLAIAYAGERPNVFKGAINFNGGWLGRLCPTHTEVNRATFVRGARFAKPTLWLHGSYDQSYRIGHCRDNFAAFLAAGGQGSFHALKGGHGLVAQPRLWADLVASYLAAVA